MKTLLVKATLTRMSRVKDSSVNISFNTMEEVSSEEFTLMDQYFKQNGWLAFKMNEFDGTEVPKENAAVEGSLTPSQELRRSLYAKHMAMGGTKDTFAAYYNKAMAGFKRAVDNSFPEGH
ncbi:hypothetical protein [Caudoviricetes sp.]|nr:hypothetical protein [Caudoviricetes sp.]